MAGSLPTSSWRRNDPASRSRARDTIIKSPGKTLRVAEAAENAHAGFVAVAVCSGCSSCRLSSRGEVSAVRIRAAHKLDDRAASRTSPAARRCSWRSTRR